MKMEVVRFCYLFQMMLNTGNLKVLWIVAKTDMENVECPDLFPVEDKYVLIVSPQDMTAEGLEFHNGNGTVMLTGTFAKESGKFSRECVRAVDYGLDFYAPQTMETPDGRRVMIAWMKSWDVPLHVEGEKWNGMMTFPRELQMRDGWVVQNPVKELEKLQTKSSCP